MYRPPTSNIKHFIDQLKKQIIRFQRFFHRIIVLGDFNLDQNKQVNVNHLKPILHQNFTSRVKFATYCDGGILDLILDTQMSTNSSVKWLPSAYSDHFMIFYGL